MYISSLSVYLLALHFSAILKTSKMYGSVGMLAKERHGEHKKIDRKTYIFK